MVNQDLTLTRPYFLAMYLNTSLFYKVNDHQATPEPLLTAKVKK